MAIIIISCKTTSSLTSNATGMQPADTAFVETLLKQNPTWFDTILKKKNDYRVQIIYTQINRDKNNVPHFTDHYFNVDSNTYFYPASTVKMPIAFLALEKLNELKIAGVDKNTTMITDSSFKAQEHILNAPLAKDGVPSIAHYIKQIFLVSDNDAYNRLYEFLGASYINTKLKAKGFDHSVIRHRLNVSMTDTQHRNTNPVSFYDTSGNMLWSQPAQLNETKYPEVPVKLGSGYMSHGKVVNEPFEFTYKNRVALTDLHEILRAAIFPKETGNKFNLTAEDYKFIHYYMSLYCTESKYPTYDSSEYWPAYVKFILHGSQKGALPENIRIFNKPGDAYGFLTDVAYVVDFKNNVEFMVSANIYCNSDGIFNDDHYDYDTVGFPFMKHVGEAIYQYELKRKKQYQPDLSAFKFDYKE
jgi:hypothetical protein